MFDETVKELSAKALRWIVTAAKIPADSADFAVAVNYIKQGPVTLDRHGYLQSVSSSDLNAEGMSLLELALRASDDDDLGQSAFLKEDWELDRKVRIIKIIRAFEFPNPRCAHWFNRLFNLLLAAKHKRQRAEALENLSYA
jgi:hypothetical protein